MSNRVIDALHDIHTATNDVLTGYREMAARAQPEIQGVVARLTQMHERHAAEQTAELSRLREAGWDDSSLQGTVNKVVVMVRDWISDLGRDALPAVRQGEESLRKKYDEALHDGSVAESASVAAMLNAQRDTIDQGLASLPRA